MSRHRLTKQTAPAAPPANTMELWPDSADDKMKVIKSSGAVVDLEAGGGVTDHGALTGLADDDHPQYQLRSEENAANGYAGLDGSSKLTGSQQVYGSASNTACVGNDARLSDARTPLAHTHGIADITEAAVIVREDQGNTYTTGAQNFSAATSLTVPVSAGAAPTVSGQIAYDSTAQQLEYGDNGTGRVVVNTNETQALSNKGLSSCTIDPTCTAQLLDSNLNLFNGIDPTKEAAFSFAAISPATVRVYSFPDDDMTVVGHDTTQTLTNKSISGANNTVTALPTSSLNDDAVTYAKIQNVTDARLLGRSAGSSGDVQEITVGSGLSLAAGSLTATGGGGGEANTASNIGAGGVGLFDAKVGVDLQFRNINVVDTARLSVAHDDPNNEVDLDIPTNAIDNTRLRDSAGFSVIGKATTGTGDPADITAADETVLGRTGAGNLAFAQVATGQIANDAVTYAKIQNLATDRLLGRDTAASGDAEELTVGGGVEFTGSGGIQRSGLTGDVTASAGSNATTIANDAVTYAKMQNVSATDKVLGRSSSGAGDVEEIACTAAGRAILDDADAAAQLTTLGVASATLTFTNKDLTATTNKRRVTKGLIIENPTASENIGISFVNRAVTLTQVRAVLKGLSSVTYQVKHGTDRSAAGDNGTTSAAVTSTTTGTNATLSDATVVADSWIWLVTTAFTGTGTFELFVEWTED